MSLLHITSDSPVVETENAIVRLKLEEALCKQAVRPELAKPGSNSKAFPHTPSAGPFSIPHLQGLSPYPISRAFPPSASLLDQDAVEHARSEYLEEQKCERLALEITRNEDGVAIIHSHNNKGEVNAFKLLTVVGNFGTECTRKAWQYWISLCAITRWTQ